MPETMAQFLVGDTFDTFEEFERKFKEYQADNHVVFVKDSGKRHNSHSSLQEALVYENVKYGCKQGPHKHKSRSKGIRPNQKTFKVGCLASLHVVTREVDGKFVLQVRASNLVHNNHPVTPEMAAVYPENRRVEIDETIVSLVSQPDITNKRLKEYLETHQPKPVTSQQLGNLKAKLGYRKHRVKKSGSPNGNKVLVNSIGLKPVKKFEWKPGVLTSQQRTSIIPQYLDKGWLHLMEKDALYKEFVFNTFSQAFRFITGVALEAEKMNHFPQWTNFCNKVEITLTTTSVGGLTPKDISLAAAIDAMVA